jgi:hypothetical protein
MIAALIEITALSIKGLYALSLSGQHVRRGVNKLWNNFANKFFCNRLWILPVRFSLNRLIVSNKNPKVTL